MTDQPKWTPGPWSLNIRASTGDVNGELVAEIEPTNSPGGYRGDITRLQSACHIDGIGHEELTANALLIAAAPDLYEALRPFADIGISENPDYQPMIRLDRDAILAARAALAKARGETK